MARRLQPPDGFGVLERTEGGVRWFYPVWTVAMQGAVYVQVAYFEPPKHARRTGVAVARYRSHSYAVRFILSKLHWTPMEVAS